MSSSSIGGDSKPPSRYSTMMESIWPTAKGLGLGGLVSVLVTPPIMIKNALQVAGAQGSKMNQVIGVIRSIKWASAPRVAGLLSSSVVPQAGITFAVSSVVQKQLFGKSKTEMLTSRERLLAAIVAGGVAGLGTTPLEFLIQNNDKGWAPTIKAVKKGGLRVAWRGGTAVGSREAVYAAGYLVLAKKISEWMQPYITNEGRRDLIGAVLAGVATGIITTPPDFLRANRQCLKKNWTYYHALKQEGVSALMRGFAFRGMAAGIAIPVMYLGNKYL